MKKLKNAQPVLPTPVFQMRITGLNNGTISVTGFPPNLDNALKIMDEAKNVLVKWFIDKARAGDLNDRNTVVEKNIIVPKSRIIKPG